MPWLPMYISRPDTSLLMELLLHDPDIAFLVPDGSKRWRAAKEMDAQRNERVGLWHVPSGPLPLLPPVHGDPIQQIHDPWLGWEEERTGADPNTPFFAAHTGVFWLNLHVEGKDRGSCCGLSSFEWVGNYYKIIGKGSQPSTEDWWKSLRRRILRMTHKVPRQSFSSSLPKEIFAFPHAYSLLKEGAIADNNPY